MIPAALPSSFVPPVEVDRGQNGEEEVEMPDESQQRMGPWGKFVALFLGAPPFAVHATDFANDDDDKEPGPAEQPPQR